MRKYFTLENFVLLLLFLITVNLVFLDINYFQNRNKQDIVTPVQAKSDCPDCLIEINNLKAQVNKLMQIVGVSITPIPTPTPIYIINNPSTVENENSVKEFYIPFGSGSGNYSDWTDVPGLQAYIDSTAYGKIKNVVFEASLHIPTANQTATVRLVNATDGRVILGSELNFTGSADSVFLSSSPVILDYGKKLYKIQLKTQLKYNAIIDQTRVHITTQ